MKRKDNWIQIRKKLYTQLEKEVHHRLGRTSSGLLNYRENYERAFQGRWEVTNQRDFFSEISLAKVIMLGDFHALRQSQKSHLRILRQLVELRPLVLTVEFINASDQPWLDRYMAGSISETEFLKTVKWDEEWGFPWENYRILLEWARGQKVEVYGINQTQRSRTANTLRLRDEFSAELIAHLSYAFEEATVVVIYGDLHLADEHLLEKIIAYSDSIHSSNIYRVYQNSEILYFKLMELGMDIGTDILKSSKNQYCLMSVAPWVKWQNYLLFLEQELDSVAGIDFDSDHKSSYSFDEEDEDEDEDDFEEVGIEYADHIERYVNIIANDLKITVTTDQLAIYSEKDLSFLDRVSRFYSAEELSLIQKLMDDEKSVYCVEMQAGILGRPNLNHASQLAMGYILSTIYSEAGSVFLKPEELERNIWRECLIYLGSKLINPRQKTDTLMDLQSLTRSKDSKDALRESLQVALSQRLRELMLIEGVVPAPSLMIAKDRYSYVVASQLLGRMMAEKVFFAFQMGKITTHILTSLVNLEKRPGLFVDNYLKIVKKINSLPEPFKSKKDRL